MNLVNVGYGPRHNRWFCRLSTWYPTLPHFRLVFTAQASSVYRRVYAHAWPIALLPRFELERAARAFVRLTLRVCFLFIRNLVPVLGCPTSPCQDVVAVRQVCL